MNGSFNFLIRGVASRVLIFTVASLCLMTLSLRAATYAPGDIIHNPGGPEPHFVIKWQAQPGKVYDILAASELGQDWEPINDEPLTAASLVESFVDTSIQQSRFYTIRKRDTEPPSVEALFPREGAIAARRQETLTVDLSDETGIDPGSIQFQIADGPPITVTDPRLTFAGNRLSYTPTETETLGGYGETVTIQFSASDTLGHKLENFAWTFQLELETTLAAFIGIGQPPGINLQSNDEPVLQLISIDGDEYKFSYTGDTHGISIGSLLVSFDPATPFKIRALEIEDDAVEKIVTLQTEPISLAELIEEGSIRIGGDEEPSSEVMLAAVRNVAGHRIFTESLDGKVLYESDDILIRVITGEVTFDIGAILSGDFKRGRLVAFDFDASTGLRYKMDVEVTAKKSLSTQGSRPILTPIRTFIVAPTGLPIWAELVIELEAGFEAEAAIAGELRAGIDFYKVANLQARWRNGSWTQTTLSPPPRLQTFGPEWQIEGAARAKVFLEPKVTIYLESLFGPSLNLKPYLELDGQFQSNPLAYDWGLHAGLTSELAINLRGWDSQWGELPSWTLFDFRHTLKTGKYPEEPSPPTILSHPANATVQRGDTATFSVTASGSPAPAYQWFFNNERIPGAPTSSLVLPDVHSGHAGSYSVQVSNPQQTVTSQTATLTVQDVNAPPSGMALIPAGAFAMGDSFSEGWSEEGPVHTVYVSAFYMDRTEVTKALWDEVRAWGLNNGYTDLPVGGGKAANHPVYDVDWYDVVKWCNARSEKEQRIPAYYTSPAQTTIYKTGQVDVRTDWVKWNAGYRLPTEAEWEKAARGGASGQRFPWGNTITHGHANYYSHWWPAGQPYYPYDVNSTSGYHPSFQSGVAPYTSPVGYFEPNGYGLYDMAGNVWEWCWDWWNGSYYSSSPSTDPRGPTSGSIRVLRGGSWYGDAFNCRAAYRNNDGYWPDYGVYNMGLRSVLPPGQP